MHDIVKIYKTGKVELKALHGIDLQVEEGEFITIMGPSGSGKSTLMNIIGCLDVPTSGSYRLEGTEISTLSENQLAVIRNMRLGFIFQNYNLLPRATAQQNVELPLIYSGRTNSIKRAKRALEMLDMVNLRNWASHKPTELSGGQSQRVTIARALTNDPAIILADEPTGNLDYKSGLEIMEIFQKLNDNGKTIVLVTHEEYIADHAKRKIRLFDGRMAREEMISNRVFAKEELKALA
ncbi:MAG: ABC transporter ATP-binding protein [Actinobacteria bacterium]|nr:ABC transporter ATP-binding protein [Actinomycetota bacterium]